MSARSSEPLVYSCSGSSNVAQLANYIAVRLDRHGIAEMSCIAGVGGDVKPLVRTATSGRRIIAIDGCPLACCEAILRAKGVVPDKLVRLHELGLKKRQRVDFDTRERDAVFARVLTDIAPAYVGARASQSPLPRRPAASGPGGPATPRRPRCEV